MRIVPTIENLLLALRVLSLLERVFDPLPFGYIGGRHVLHGQFVAFGFAGLLDLLDYHRALQIGHRGSGHARGRQDRLGAGPKLRRGTC